MGTTALQYALDRYVGDGESFGADTYEVRVGRAKARSAFFGSRVKLSVQIIVVFRTNELSFCEIQREAYKRIEGACPRKISKIDADWFILSDRGGIYLFEEIAKKENARYQAMRNRFIVLNTGDGTVSFGPGHPENGQATERTRALLLAQRVLPEDIWLTETFKVFDSCRSILAAR